MKKSSNESSKNCSRRAFLRAMGGTAAVLAMDPTSAFSIAPSSILGKSHGYVAPSDLINIAGIGIGSQGGGDIQNFATPDNPIERKGMANALMQKYAGIQPPKRERRASDDLMQRGDADKKAFKHANIYALCDVDTDYAAHIFNGYPKAKKFTDWRKVLEDKSVDAVVIGTPDHNHAIIAANAMMAGKHVFVEKPMAKTIYECRYLAKLAAKTGLVTQMGNQGHNIEGTFQTIEWIQAGLIGDVTEVHMWSNRPMWRQGYVDRPAGVAVPSNLDYDLWLGPAPQKPYNPETTHFAWRGLWDYGTGAMGDMGAHTFDAPILALKLGMPVKIQATTTPYNSEYLPQSEFVQYEFAAREGMPPVTVTWSDGGIKPFRPKELEASRQLRECLYVGSKGLMMHGTHGALPELIPQDPGFTAPAKTLHRPSNIYVDFVEAIQQNRKSANDFAVSSKLTEIMLLTNIAVAAQNMNITLEYDAENMKITNLPEANDYFHYEYRNGWSLPKID